MLKGNIKDTAHYSWASFGFLGTGLPPFQQEITDFLDGRSVETLLASKGEKDLRAAVLELSPDAAGFLGSIVDQIASSRYQKTLEQMQELGISA